MFFVMLVEFLLIAGSLFYLQKLKFNLHNLIIGIGICILTLITYILFEPWAAIIFFFSSTAIILLWKSNFFKICLDFISIILIGMVSDHIAQIISSTSSINNIYFQLLVFLFCYMSLFTLFQFIINRLKVNNQYVTLPAISRIILSLLACITVIVLYLNIFIPSTHEELWLTKFNLIVQLSYLLIISLLSLFLIKNIKKENELRYQKMKQSQFTNYMVSLEEVNKDMQNFRHDYLNILTTISGYIMLEDMEKLKAYFNNKIVKVENDTLRKNLILKDLSNLEIIELKGILTTKLLISTEKNIDLHIEIPEKIKSIDMDIIDFSRILGILIDNAIEASEKSQNPQINIAFLQTSSSCLFVIENTFEGQIDIGKIYRGGFSTKSKDRGYGLKNVLEIKDHYPNLFLNTRLENNFFIQELELTNRK